MLQWPFQIKSPPSFQWTETLQHLSTGLYYETCNSGMGLQLNKVFTHKLKQDTNTWWLIQINNVFKVLIVLLNVFNLNSEKAPGVYSALFSPWACNFSFIISFFFSLHLLVSNKPGAIIGDPAFNWIKSILIWVNMIHFNTDGWIALSPHSKMVRILVRPEPFRVEFVCSSHVCIDFLCLGLNGDSKLTVGVYLGVNGCFSLDWLQLP